MLADKTHVVEVEDPTRQDQIKKMVNRVLLRFNSNASLVSPVLKKRPRVVKVVKLLVVMAKDALEDDPVVVPKTVENIVVNTVEKTVEKTAVATVVMVNDVEVVKIVEVAMTVAVVDKEMELKLSPRKLVPTILLAKTRV